MHICVCVCVSFFSCVLHTFMHIRILHVHFDENSCAYVVQWLFLSFVSLSYCQVIIVHWYFNKERARVMWLSWCLSWTPFIPRDFPVWSDLFRFVAVAFFICFFSFYLVHYDPQALSVCVCFAIGFFWLFFVFPLPLKNSHFQLKNIAMHTMLENTAHTTERCFILFSITVYVQPSTALIVVGSSKYFMLWLSV